MNSDSEMTSNVTSNWRRGRRSVPNRSGRSSNLGRLVAIVAIVAAAVMLVDGVFVGGVGSKGAAAAHAAPATSAVAKVPLYGAPRETSKVVLPEMSHDGPAFWTQRGPSSPQGPTMVIAWTGTDGRLNFMSGYDGVHFSAKKTLRETSFVRPAVQRGLAGVITLAWTGTDPGHHLNVLYAANGATPVKLTLWHEASFTAPALGWFSTEPTALLLAWTGTDPGHSLNVLPVTITDHGLVAGTKFVLGYFHSRGQPTLDADASAPPTQPRFLLSWIDMASQRIAWATAPDGKEWIQQPMFHEASGSAPSMIGIKGFEVPEHWLGWTGTDPTHHVNVQYTLDLIEWATNNVKSTLTETAIGGAVVGFDLHESGTQVFVAWTGTDPAHHLNVAKISV